MSSKTAEFEQLVLFKLTGKLDVVEVVKAIDRIPQRLVVLFLDEQVVVRVIDRLDVEL